MPRILHNIIDIYLYYNTCIDIEDCNNIKYAN